MLIYTFDDIPINTLHVCISNYNLNRWPYYIAGNLKLVFCNFQSLIFVAQCKWKTDFYKSKNCKENIYKLMMQDIKFFIVWAFISDNIWNMFKFEQNDCFHSKKELIL